MLDCYQGYEPYRENVKKMTNSGLGLAEYPGKVFFLATC